jgi:hypothetical protein
MPIIGSFGAGSAGGFGQRKGGIKLEGIDYLVLAGGGSGGASGYEGSASGGLGGGGGAGGYITSYGVPERSTETITEPVTITVGAGGAGGITPAPGPRTPMVVTQHFLLLQLLAVELAELGVVTRTRR